MKRRTAPLRGFGGGLILLGLLLGITLTGAVMPRLGYTPGDHSLGAMLWFLALVGSIFGAGWAAAEWLD